MFVRPGCAQIPERAETFHTTPRHHVRLTGTVNARCATGAATAGVGRRGAGAARVLGAPPRSCVFRLVGRRECPGVRPSIFKLQQEIHKQMFTQKRKHSGDDDPVTRKFAARGVSRAAGQATRGDHVAKSGVTSVVKDTRAMNTQSGPSGPHPAPTSFIPRSLDMVVCTPLIKSDMKKWIADRGRKPCFISGPTGVGKTALACAVMHGSGREPTVLYAGDDNFFDQLHEIVTTRPRPPNSVGLVIDNVGGASASTCTRIAKTLATPSMVPVVVIAIDASRPPLKPLLKLCSPHARFTRHGADRVLQFLGRVAPTLSTRDCNAIITDCGGDLRQATIRAELALRSAPGVDPTVASIGCRPDVRQASVFAATEKVLCAKTLDQAEHGVTYDQVVPAMVHASMVNVAFAAGDNDMDRLGERLDLMGFADILESHPSHTTHAEASVVHAAAGMGMSARNTVRTKFPESVVAKKRALRERVKRVSCAHNPVHEAVPELKMRIQSGAHKMKKDDVSFFNKTIL